MPEELTLLFSRHVRYLYPNGDGSIPETYEVMKKNQYGQYLKDVLDGKYVDAKKG